MARLRPADGFTVGELLIVILIVGVLGALASVLLQSARMSGNESSAVASMRTIVSGQAAYAAFNNGYAGSLQALAAMCSGMKVGFISPDLSANGMTKAGYVLSTVPGAGANSTSNDCNRTPTHTKFYATAAPAAVGSTGRRAFAATTTSSIWQNTAGTPPPEPITASATVSVLGR